MNVIVAPCSRRCFHESEQLFGEWSASRKLGRYRFFATQDPRKREFSRLSHGRLIPPFPNYKVYLKKSATTGEHSRLSEPWF
jgi:hypothetical protein